MWKAGAQTLLVALLLASARGAQDSRPSPTADPKVAVDELRRLVESKRFADAWKKRQAVRTAVAAPAVAEALRLESERLLLSAGIEVVGAAAGFQGIVEVVEPGLVEARYDFGVSTFEQDFELLMPLPTAKHPTWERRKVRGTGALCHRALWTSELRVEILGRPLQPTDFGPVFIDPDETATERFLTGFHNNAYFGIKYDADRAVTAGHILLLAGRGAVSRARSRPTQLLGRTEIPVIARLTEVRCSLSARGTIVEFTTGTSPTATGRMTFELAAATQTFPRMRAGILFRDSEFEIATIVLRGRLDPTWEREEAARLRASVKQGSGR